MAAGFLAAAGFFTGAAFLAGMICGAKDKEGVSDQRKHDVQHESGVRRRPEVQVGVKGAGRHGVSGPGYYAVRSPCTETRQVTTEERQPRRAKVT